MLDVLENYRELVTGLTETYLSSQSHHRTEVSLWNMPELSWPLGYPLALLVMAAVAGHMSLNLFPL